MIKAFPFRKAFIVFTCLPEPAEGMSLKKIFDPDAVTPHNPAHILHAGSAVDRNIAE